MWFKKQKKVDRISVPCEFCKPRITPSCAALRPIELAPGSWPAIRNVLKGEIGKRAKNYKMPIVRNLVLDDLGRIDGIILQKSNTWIIYSELNIIDKLLLIYGLTVNSARPRIHKVRIFLQQNAVLVCDTDVLYYPTMTISDEGGAQTDRFETDLVFPSAPVAPPNTNCRIEVCAEKVAEVVFHGWVLEEKLKGAV